MEGKTEAVKQFQFSLCSALARICLQQGIWGYNLRRSDEDGRQDGRAQERKGDWQTSFSRGGGVSLSWIICQLLLSLFILMKKASWAATSRDMSLINRFFRYAGW